MVPREDGESRSESLCQLLAGALRDLTARSRAHRNDDPWAARAQGVDLRLVTQKRLQHVEEKQFVVGLLFLRALLRHLGAAAIFAALIL